MIFWLLLLWLGHLSCSFNILPLLFNLHHAEVDIHEQCLFLHLLFQKISSSSHLHSKNLWFITTTTTTSSFDNFDDSLWPRISLFVFTYLFIITIMFSSNTPCLGHLFIENPNIQKEHSVDNHYIFVPRFKKNKIDLYVYILIIFAKKLLSLVICSWLKLSLLITSPNRSSTLTWVFFMISDLLSV